MIEITRTGKNPLVIDNPVMPAAGIFGYDGSAYSELIDLSKLGALVTNPITWRGRRVARGPRLVSLPAGVLVHTGLPNPGLPRVVEQYGTRWKRGLLPVIVHIVATTPEDVVRCADVLDRCDGVAAIELGLHDQSTPADVETMIGAVLDHTQLALLVRLPLYTAVGLARAASDAGAGALVVAAPPRGTARDPLTGVLAGGRLYGPWLKAQALRAVGQIAPIVEVPVIGSGGIHSPDDARDFLEAGAVAVQVDTLVWTQPHMLEVIARNLGGLELTRATGALADEWQPGMGQTMFQQRQNRPTLLDDDTAADPPDRLPE
ncbi:MAG: dihydroorotate dehydrogenase [Chloroflexi bacterium]|nr:dihydroorotate dehydrogenase [Chloroflexota bacterium]